MADATHSLANRLSKVSIHSGGGGGGCGGGEKAVSPLSRVQRKTDFRHVERVNGRTVNILEGLELHTRVFSAAEQQQIVECVHEYREKGRRGLLRERTYSEPRRWMRGKGRVTIQFGCCYNYATDRNGNPPGIIRDEEVDPIPPLLRKMIRRMVEWRVLPATCVPDSCIVNIYDKGDCIPPHIDHHDFVRPFCTVSFLTECDILFGRELKVLAPGEFSGAASISLPVGSVLVLKGNGADVAKHCVPAVPAKRISITFRKMDDSKLPFTFAPDPELHTASPANTQQQQARPRYRPREQAQPATTASPMNAQQAQAASPATSTTPRARRQTPPRDHQASSSRQGPRTQGRRPPQYQQAAYRGGQSSSNSFDLTADDFPALGSSPASGSRGRR